MILDQARKRPVKKVLPSLKAPRRYMWEVGVGGSRSEDTKAIIGQDDSAATEMDTEMEEALLRSFRRIGFF